MFGVLLLLIVKRPTVFARCVCVSRPLCFYRYYLNAARTDLSLRYLRFRFENDDSIKIARIVFVTRIRLLLLYSIRFT